MTGSATELPKELCVQEEEGAEQNLAAIMDTISQMGDSATPEVLVHMEHQANKILNNIREDEGR